MHGEADTSPDAERVRVELLRSAGPSRRAALALSLSQTCSDLARAALRRAHPEASEQEIRLLYAEEHYGRDLAGRVRRYLEERASPSSPRSPE